MPRTTLDLDPGVLRELKRRRKETGRSIGQIASELLTGALAEPAPPTAHKLEWKSRRMGARVELEDKEALNRLLDRG